MSAYLQEFKGREDIEKEYGCTLPADAEILLAWYGYGSWCGDSFVLYRQNGELYEVNAGHCSCYGLKDQWRPERTTVEALRLKVNGWKESYGRYDGEEEAYLTLAKLLDQMEAA